MSKQLTRFVLLLATFSVASGPVLLAQAQGALELSLALGRKLYAQTDDESMLAAKKRLASECVEGSL